MIKIAKIIHLSLFLGVLVAFSACQSSSGNSQRRLAERQVYAEQRTQILADCLERHVPMDSIRAVAERDEDVLFYVFDARQMVYWSSNRLAADELYLTTYDTWRNLAFSNAKTVARWTRSGEYNILTVIPTEYTALQDYTEMYSVASQSFSFRPLPQDNEQKAWHGRLYFILCIILFSALVLLAVIGLVRYRGIRNMPLTTRIMYVIIGCVLAVFVYVFVMSVRYVQTNYEQRQRESLVTRSEYVQSYLRSLYYWDVSLTSSQSTGLAIDLHDLGYDINQDIHVYSLSGELIASSSPALFNSGLLSRRMAPQAMFATNHSTLCYEYLATHRYLVYYQPFYNGSFVPVGYIAVPYFLSEQTRNQEVDNLLARLLPPYIIVLLLALFFSFWAARSMTAPIAMINEKMRRFEIGGKDNHIDYPYHDELGELVERYNILVDRVEESAERLARAEREGAWRTMARQIAHEINNPLTPMKLSVQKLQLKRGTDGFDDYFDKTTKMLVAEIDNLAHIAQSFSAFAKQPEVIATEVDVAQKLSNVITLQRANDEQIPIRYVGPDSGVPAVADNEQIAQVFINILRNAIQALSEKEFTSPNTPDIIVVLNAAYSDEEVQISFSDNGPGIPAEAQPRIFRPNFTTKTNGNGLGLAISKHIVEGAGGRIDFASNDKGTTFFVYLKKK
ncbi:MAG: hypothetical protein IJ814_02925 [Paludibacteraceae bacterium]|nr:hypothetical protein [Paludibacteraceae bacterium]